MPKIEARRLSHAIGAEVTGVDLRQPLDAATVAAINALWDEHLLLLFRDQPMTPAQHVAFTRYFGTPTTFDVDHVMEGHPEVLRITNKLIDNKPSNTRNTAAALVTLPCGLVMRTVKEALSSLSAVVAIR